MSTESFDPTPPLDVSAFRDRTANDLELMHDLVALFQSDYSRQRENIRSAVQLRDSVKLRAAAHAVKGTAASFSAGPAMNAAAALEHMGTRGDLSRIAEACYVLDYEFDRLHQALALLWDPPLSPVL